MISQGSNKTDYIFEIVILRLQQTQEIVVKGIGIITKM